jgi:phosphoglycolate phosphatase-like HAD superfamily hydrolase
MPAPRPRLVALDFDGVVCDGMPEFFASAWAALARLGPEPPAAGRRPELSARFAALRPAIESGWEMVLLLAVLAGRPAARDGELVTGWAGVRDAWVHERGLAPRALADALDQARDEWFARDAGGWLACHAFYPGMVEWLRAAAPGPRPVYVITTKERRFAEALLASQDIALGDGRVIGKAAPKREKYEVLRELIARHALPRDGDGVWFVEDRVQTLLDLVAQAPDLHAARLFFATWGFTFPEVDGPRARGSGRIEPLALGDLTHGAAWAP